MVLYPKLMLHTIFLLVQNNDTKLNDLTAKSNDPVLKSSKYSTTPSPQEACYDKFGCFDTRAPWVSPTRSFHYVPEPPNKVNPKFCLRTRLNRDHCQLLNWKDTHSLYQSYLIPDQKTFFIIHGYIENYNRPWMQKLAKEMLRLYDANVVIVDWSAGAIPPYAQATANTRLVGAMTAYLINIMITQLGMKADDMHVVGHSLGAHTAGYVGQALHEKYGHKLGRITGLDPAEPFFTDSHPLVRLDPSDAHFVDAIHTDTAPFASGGMGIRQPVGHVDFYPNGGRNQPGCGEGVSNYITEKDSMIFGLEKYLNCNHVRSNDFFIDSFLDDCPLWGVQCESWEHYKNGSCFSCFDHTDNRVTGTAINTIGQSYKGPRCAQMGFHSMESIDRNYIKNAKPTKYFLITSDKAPFCQNQYRITVYMSNSSKSISHGGEIGKMSINIKGSGGETTNILINTRERFFEPGSVFRQVISGPRVGLMMSANLKWDYETSVNPLTWRFLTSPCVYIAKVTIDSIEHNDRMVIAPPVDTPLISSKPLDCTRVDREGAYSTCQVIPLKPL